MSGGSARELLLLLNSRRRQVFFLARVNDLIGLPSHFRDSSDCHCLLSVSCVCALFVVLVFIIASRMRTSSSSFRNI
jgi:hypothetical protein